ncbi:MULTISPECIES: ABC transporter substrate-binding protein [unclassified Leucobacter]|uniref:ABC transporter substrate-binding protein n=1 Tax=unclassified Leucobacter TaxID=2621730 RepID=UPI00165EA001|nr:MULTISPECIES: ABC transporter substrate-binding protein [unclassified Leucobacter]MBC9927807.1 ABC transporter substrate-binding protein [Leucobacter sp. cx-169]
MKTRTMLPALLVLAALGLTGCVNNAANEAGTPNIAEGPTVEVDTAAEALLPADIRDRGVLVLGVNPSYSPNEFKDAEGNPTGWTIQLTDAVAAKLGLESEWRQAKFDSLIPSITGGKMDVGASSFTDNAERQQVVDFVNYYTAGVQWAAPAGKTVDPDNACGLKVAVQSGTFEHTDEVPAKSEACVASGKDAIQILPFDSQEDASNAVALGKADALSADSPVTLYAIKKMDGKLVAAGGTFDEAPYGFAIAKGSDLVPAIQAAVQSLIDDGTYLDILTEWGVEGGALETATLNAGQ